MSCRLAARKLVLELDSNGSKLEHLNFELERLSTEIDRTPDNPMNDAVKQFRDDILEWKDEPNSRKKGPLLQACDLLRDVLRADGFDVIDSPRSRVLLC